ncbi:type II toxin-antitoxin system RelE/ParE family toxin [Mesorhizobium sp. VK23B]|uniref:Type II toxin-antitoxin system RelE/ParE family toxin n=1 Tax=Mesorhizobium dulcispinae TaxID=3072316 RepID=A0ABU4XK94_9HYPH|nr:MULTISPECIES: type II toxin-antitoxin system RelE/ParE family toxin [unclassified Mesorhizobium]MDX8468666.1 type II toxin-antitoxin system RelE/ParE family toxin [Mesorhizobium sp. VK23B]MDX8474993.1 type II toxin-antitoxin system RelE/ParE family toxin [Mesorhizobium sp. VK23A]
MRRLIVAAQAELDLEVIAEHIARDNPFRAVTFLQELRNACAELRTMPERYPLVPRHQSSGIRRRVHGSYLIFFHVSADTVEILHVLHGAMDYEQILFPGTL